MAQPSPLASSQTNVTKVGKGKCALIVDDMSTMRRLLSVPCRGLGYRVEFANNGAEALQRIYEGMKSPDRYIDLVLCDWRLPPGMDGIEVLEELDEQGMLEEEMLFFMVTASDSISEVYRAAETILPAYLTKANLTVKTLEKKIIAATKGQEYRSLLRQAIEIDQQQNRAEKNLMVKYKRSIYQCKKIFKEMWDEKTEQQKVMHQNRISFLQRKLMKAKELVGEYGMEQQEELKKMLETAKKNYENRGRVLVPTWPLRKVASLFEEERWYEAALRQYALILKQVNPASAWVHVDVGRMHERLGHDSEALHFYRKAVELNPKFQKGRDAIAALLAKMGHYKEAIEIYKEAVELSPDKPERLREKGNVHMAIADTSNHAEAEGCYMRVLELEERRVDKLSENNMNVGRAMMRQPEKIGAAKEFLDTAIEVAEKRAGNKTSSDQKKKARVARGEFYLRVGQKDVANTDFEEAKTIQEDSKSILTNNGLSAEIARTFFSTGYDEDGVAWMTDFISKDPKNPEKQTVFREVLEENNHGGDVDKILQGALEHVEEYVQKVNAHAKDLRKKGEFMKAVREYDEILNENPSDEGLWFNKGRALFDLSEASRKKGIDKWKQYRKNAVFYFKKALELDNAERPQGEKGRIYEALKTVFSVVPELKREIDPEGKVFSDNKSENNNTMEPQDAPDNQDTPSTPS